MGRSTKMNGFDGMMDGVGFFWGPWMLLPALFWVAFIGLIVWGVVRILSVGQSGGRADSAEEILRQRFATGEMDAEEYERSLEALRRGSSQKGYEDYVREAEEELGSEREARP
jgi:putative membrane protein